MRHRDASIPVRRLGTGHHGEWGGWPGPNTGGNVCGCSAVTAHISEAGPGPEHEQKSTARQEHRARVQGHPEIPALGCASGGWSY